jgi:predicted nucleic acid-binding protein
MRIYLDSCALQRPLDDRTQLRISVEAEAILGILTLAKNGQITLVASEVLEYEINRITNPQRREYALEILRICRLRVEVDEFILQYAREFKERGIMSLDALHLACAMMRNVDYFCTSDDKFLRKAKMLNSLSMHVVSPLELVVELEL